MNKNSASSQFVKLLNIILSKWYICVSFAVIFSLAVTGYVLYMKKPQYLASTTIFVYNETSSAAIDGGVNYSDVLTAEKLAKDCAVLATSNAVLNEARAHIPKSITIYPRNIAISLIPNTRIIELSVVDSNPNHAATIANNVADVLIKVAMDKAQIQDMAIIDYLPVSSSEDGVITVPAKLLAEFVSNLPKGETIELVEEKDGYLLNNKVGLFPDVSVIVYLANNLESYTYK